MATSAQIEELRHVAPRERVIGRPGSTTRSRGTLGAVLYLASFQYFVVQLIVARRWTPGYSVRLNTISDLANSACGRFNGRFVCSPWHDLMNASFVLLGLTMIAGSLLVRRALRGSRTRDVGFLLLGIGGVGVVMVGLFPENSFATLHGIGATLPFLVGNVGLVLLGLKLEAPRALRIYTFVSGALALVALGFYARSMDLGLGEGGMERIVAYPQTLWLIVFAAYDLVTRARTRRSDVTGRSARA